MSTESDRDNGNGRGGDSVQRAMTPATPVPERRGAERDKAHVANAPATDAAGNASGKAAGAAPGPTDASAKSSAAGAAGKSGGAGARSTHAGREVRGGGRFATALAAAALLVAIGAAAAGYYAWRDLETRAATRAADGDAALRGFEARLDAFGDRVGANQRALVERNGEDEALRAGIAGLDRRLSETQEAQAALREEIQAALDAFHRPALAPVDVERLMLIANDAVSLQRDPDVALAALRVADRRLAAFADPAYAGVRRQLAGEIAALESAPRPDVAGIAYGLAAMQPQLRGLEPRIGPARTAPGETSEETLATADTAPEDGATPRWQVFFSDLWQTLSGLVVIRRTGSDEGPLLAPEQHDALVQNIELRLASARLAALDGDERNFRLDVRQARDWLQQYYGTEQPAAAGLIARLDEYAGVELHPELPDVSGSLAALRGVMQHRAAAPETGGESRREPPPSQPAVEAPAEAAVPPQRP